MSTSEIRLKSQYYIASRLESLENQKAPTSAQETQNNETKNYNSNEYQKQSKMNFKRRRENENQSLCFAILKGEECQKGDKCNYLHDIKEYLSNKLPDIHDSCLIYDKYGYCPASFTCRMGSKHIINNEKTGRFESICKPINERIDRNETTKNILTPIMRKTLRTIKLNDRDNFDSKLKQKIKIMNSNNSGSNNDGSNNDGSNSNSNSNSNEDAFNLTEYPSPSIKPIDWNNKIYIAPLTTLWCSNSCSSCRYHW